MRHDLYRVMGFVLVTIVGLLGIAAFLYVITSLPLQGKGPEWIGAIGTVATLIGTIYLATSESRRREREELVKARLHGASMVLRLAYAEAAIDAVLSILYETGKIDGAPTFLETCKAKLATIDTWSIEELIPLSPLPDKTALKLAEAADQLRAFGKILDQKIATGNIYVSESRKELAREMHDNLVGTRRFICEAIVVCRAGVTTTHLSTD